ncbi:CDP-alcohol phosphatidyltransferase family protein [Actinomadura decatromicini]|uniref:CDP-alcohol phosphatidyltransferase family protein n=1 Tax=Actinomadura decatromicini TaxID=2604572 RepID=A0A5D3FAH0_9ACTN|nr:CDP-alcohol phosphatidyltransferase family protein [Actinomadura decatromicini]TYK44914.1 CDP-alcohol phosphatidyltransferase family protein [Actinomadura decatromicini]
MSTQSTQREAQQDRIFTVPNSLSLARLVGVPLFLWLVLVEADWWALGLLVFAGLSDWLDGKLARVLNQTSKLGAMLDPAADRLYILATLVGLTIRDIIPLWLVVLLVARELAIVPIAPIVRRLGYSGTLPVHFIGKAGTLCLLYAFPLLLLGDHDGTAATVAKVIGWSFAIWGAGLYWWAAVLYWEQTRQLVVAARGAPPPPVPDPDPEGEQEGAETPR